MFDDLRQRLENSVRTIHQATYPSLLVDLPNTKFHDPEQVDPFVEMRVLLIPSQMGLGTRAQIVEGHLQLYFYYRPGTGTKQQSDYSDFLLSNLAMYNINGITFKEVRPYPDQGKEGWEGTLNVIRFTIQYFNV